MSEDLGFARAGRSLQYTSAAISCCCIGMASSGTRKAGSIARVQGLLRSQIGALRINSPRLRLSTVVASVQREWRYYVVLLLLFLLSFSIPIFVVVQMKDSLAGASGSVDSARVDVAPEPVSVPEVSVRESSPAVERPQIPAAPRSPVDEEAVDPFATARLLSGESFVRVRATEHILPGANSDFAALLWLKPRRLPATGEVMVLLSKIDSEHRNRPGYQLTLTRDSAGLRAQVYWRNSARLGGWFNFTDLRIEPQQWIALALSVRRGRYLGLHLVEYPEGIERPSEARVTLLGGYDLGRVVLPDSRSDLLVGPFNKNLFRGLIGPWGVIRSDALTGTLREALEEIARDPRKPAQVFGGDAVQFWTIDGVTDLSQHQHALSTEGDRK